jgi:AcrR family transcriptional regulator
MSEKTRKGATQKPGRPATRPKKANATPRTNEQWSAASIEQLIGVARREFSRRGYVDTSIDRIAAEANLTKGAVYYHFRSKEGLFEAVLRQVQRDLTARIEAHADASGSPLDAVRAGCEVFLELATDDELRQIVLTDAPSVLGWSKWRAIDAEYGLGSLKQGLIACREANALGVSDVDVGVLAHWVSGALNEAVFLIAESADRESALAEAKRALSVLLSGLASARSTRGAR